jgi:hypothetical protein
MANDLSWKKIYHDLHLDKHDFDARPYEISAVDIKKACQAFKKTNEKEVRILCKQDTRDSRPSVFKDRGLFLLPIKNGKYLIIKGEGYIDIPDIPKIAEEYASKLDFELKSSEIGDSEMQHLDFAYASSLIRTFTNDPSLVLTIRGRKFTPKFNFKVGKFNVNVEGVQTEVDAGYEGKDQIVLIEAKNIKTKDVIIRQLYYPFRQWSIATGKKVTTIFFQKDNRNNLYSIWQFGFKKEDDYNSIELILAGKYIINKK